MFLFLFFSLGLIFLSAKRHIQRKMSQAPTHTAAATATNPPPANSPTMYGRLVHQDRTQNPEIISNQLSFWNLKNGVLSFAIWAIKFYTIGLQLSLLRSLIGDKHKNRRILQLIDWISLGANAVKLCFLV